MIWNDSSPVLIVQLIVLFWLLVAQYFCTQSDFKILERFRQDFSVSKLHDVSIDVSTTFRLEC